MTQRREELVLLERTRFGQRFLDQHSRFYSHCFGRRRGLIDGVSQRYSRLVRREAF